MVQWDGWRGLLAESRARTDSLFEFVDTRSFYEKPIPERHRVIFYRGHLEAFDLNQVVRMGLGEPPLDARLDSLFERGIDPPPGEAPIDRPEDWPALEEVREYVHRARERVDAVLTRAPEFFLHLAVEHREMHAETFAYMLHQLPAHEKHGALLQTVTFGAPPRQDMISVPEGFATLGRNEGFGWDNEFQRHEVSVPAFALSRYKVTNGEYLRFVKDGGPTPPFWTAHEDQWFCRTMFGDVPLPLDWPVYATHEQATAYAKWQNKRLPTEAEWHRAALGAPSGGERQYPWGDARPSPAYGNFDFYRWDPLPVTATPCGDSAFGFAQLCGNGWEWTSTVFSPFPGFTPLPSYPAYSADFFDGQHYVIKGASPLTSARLLRSSFRNWFRPNYPYVYAGFRLAESA